MHSVLIDLLSLSFWVGNILVIAIRLRAVWSGVRIPAGKRDFPLFSKRSDRLWVSLSFLVNGFRVSFSGIKRLGRQVDLFPSCSPEAKNV